MANDNGVNVYQFVDSPDLKGKKQHLHMLNGSPLMGVSTILSVLAKFGLTWWASGKALEAFGWTPTKTKKEERLKVALAGMSNLRELLSDTDDVLPDYLAFLDAAYRAHSKTLDDSAEQGVDMHSELEYYVRYCITENDGHPTTQGIESHQPAVKCFAEWAMEAVDKFLFSEAYCYSKDLWVGGIVDLIYKDLNGEYVLLDFKSAKEAYVNHFLQNAGYDILLSENGVFTKEGKQVDKIRDIRFDYYMVFPFGMKEPKPQSNMDLDLNIHQLREGFRHCIPLYKLMKGERFQNGKGK